MSRKQGRLCFRVSCRSIGHSHRFVSSRCLGVFDHLFYLPRTFLFYRSDRKSTCPFGSLDYPLKRDGIESGEGLVAGRERKRAASPSSSSPADYVVEIVVRGHRVHFGVVEGRETAVDQKSRGRELMQNTIITYLNRIYVIDGKQIR